MRLLALFAIVLAGSRRTPQDRRAGCAHSRRRQDGDLYRRRAITALAAFGAAIAFRDGIAQSGKVRRIGFLGARSRSTASNPDPLYDAFMRGIGDLGYVEGRNVNIEWRFADGNAERVPVLAAELVRLKPEVIVTHSTQTALALKRLTSTIPIVSLIGDPVGTGFADSLARPGRNITGVSVVSLDLGPKHLELLKSAMPKVSRVGFLLNPDNPSNKLMAKSAGDAAKRLAIELVSMGARTPEEIEQGLAVMARKRVEAVVIPSDTLFIQQRKQIADLAIQLRLASIYPYVFHIKAGGLISYGQNLADFYRRLAVYVDRILKGEDPAKLAIEQPTEFQLGINLQTAKLLGLAIPTELLLRADEVVQ